MLAGAAGLTRVGGVPLAQLAVQRLRWWHGTHAGHTSYRAEVVAARRGAAAARDPGRHRAAVRRGRPGRPVGLVRDRHTGYLTVTLRVAPVSTWLADPADADQWVANWGGWLASLGYLPSLRWVTITVDTARDPGTALTSQVAAAIDPAAPRQAIEIMDQLSPPPRAPRPTWPPGSASPSTPPPRPPAPTLADAAADTGPALIGLGAPGACGVAVDGRARAADLAGMVRAAFDPAARGEVTGCWPRGWPRAGHQLNWRRPGRWAQGR